MAPARVVIAGGGFAALEAALAVRALAEERAELTLICSSPAMAYRPAATVEAFGEEPGLSFDLPQIATDLHATYHAFALEAVAPQKRWVRLESGVQLGYDALILALGALPTAAIPGALTFRDQRDVPRVRALLGQITAGAVGRLLFAVPSRQSWSLPVYELALLSAAHAAKHSVDVEVAVVTPEREPLALLGSGASRAVANLLYEWDIRFVGGVLPHSVQRDGSLALQFEAPIAADRVVAVPELRGRRIAGIPADWSGFVPVDGASRVEGRPNIYAAGDMTSFPVKQGGIAAQQADRAAAEIAASLGLPVTEQRHTWILRARLVHGEGALALRAELDELGQPTGATIEHLESRSAEDLKVFGRYLTPYMSMYRARLCAAA
jgi:sulfide:quinone oxidoreductase